MTFGGSYGGFDTLRFWGATICFTIALPAVFEATKSIRWMNLAGDLSYPIYLVHTSVLIVFGTMLTDFTLPLYLLPPTEAGYVSIAAFLATTTVAAFLVHKVVEVPVARAMHRMTTRSRAAAPG